MKINNNNRGFSLIEIVVSIGILGIIAISMLPMFTMGFKGIVGAGNKSKNIFVSQEKAENRITKAASVSNKTIIITFPSTTEKVELPGEEITEDSIKFFIPE